MLNKNGVVSGYRLNEIRKKGPVLLLRDLEGSEVKVKYLLNRKHFVINYRTKMLVLITNMFLQ